MSEIFDPKHLKRGDKILWLYRGEVETGDVIFTRENCVDLIWLEGYKSRNDSPSFDEILAVYRPYDGEFIEIKNFSGLSRLTPAGIAYMAAKKE